jgi:hypothetical protein
LIDFHIPREHDLGPIALNHISSPRCTNVPPSFSVKNHFHGKASTILIFGTLIA